MNAKSKCEDCGTELGEIRFSEQVQRVVCIACYDLALHPSSVPVESKDAA